MTLSPNALIARLASIRLLVLDVDGVLTDGGLYYTESGEILKKFNVKDGLGIKQLINSGVEVAIISANSSEATLHRAQRLNVEHVFINAKDKLGTLKALCDRLGLDLQQVASMGDDLSDLPVMQAVGLPMTVADAMPANIACAAYVTQKGGGEGAVREVCDRLIAAQQAAQPMIQKVK
ncbi:MAG: 3-deoxy-D-manno-octulosonate 8-phosphate phosphatase (KDO 8-P phosphatase) [Phormidesmis priestleyi Ana]|uniref:3-deoxy-D-manno-octulosonate 8-phosphate phosphatase (KDO 8-P phosphatase) n=1 Tax=Phormidesmis priestleyi Ana TaxID=1666911 RepID=A0A0P8C4B8_9CYAN|nr:MAG: 3-deoxy-D-manno-octulosonate 8-phosphate phosphatase (KDO 8-P phosphatase) [Phormidesmis priestleyi Ana]